MATPTYLAFLTESFEYFRSEVGQLSIDLQQPHRYQQRLAADIAALVQHIRLFDVLVVFTFAILLTVARHLTTTKIIAKITKWRGIPAEDGEKIPESAWKFLFYFFSWSSITYYLFVHNADNYFANPIKVWQDYSLENVVEPYIYWVYVMEFSFYLHSLYTTLLVDQRRKDTNTLMFHHILCILLMLISYCNKSHKSGLLTLFLHDGCDVLLEATKLIRYFKVQHNVVYERTELFVNIGFISFLLSWISNRLYWFPLKQIYVASIYTKQEGMQVPFIFPLVLMLWTILIMNFYWFSFAVRLLLKVASGQIKELEDNREFAEGEEEEGGGGESVDTIETKITKAGKDNGDEVRKMSVDSGVYNTHSTSEEDGHSTGGGSSSSCEETTTTTTEQRPSYKLRQRRSAKA